MAARSSVERRGAADKLSVWYPYPRYAPQSQARPRAERRERQPHGCRSSGSTARPSGQPLSRASLLAPSGSQDGRRSPGAAHRRQAAGGRPPPPPDMEELVEDIEYEARVDRDVSGVVDVVGRPFEDHGKSILGVAGKCAEQADDDIEALADEDGCVDPEAVASKCRKVRLQLGHDLEKPQPTTLR